MHQGGIAMAMKNEEHISNVPESPISCSVHTNHNSIASIISKIDDNKVRNLSPNRRFNIGFGRSRRSLSFNVAEDKLGPSTSQMSASMGNNLFLDNAGSTKKGRSSPLRRLIDPILNPRSQNQHGSVEMIPPLKLNSMHKASTVHALLRVTLKNGLPLFKFVVDNNDSHILAATMANNSIIDSGESYTQLYSVKEAKKKSSGWMNQGSKEKSCGYVYNVVGEMKVSTSQSDDFTLREFLLFGGDQESPIVLANKEQLAAIILEIPNLEDTNERKPSNKDVYSYTVILPGGFHSLPINGEPSPLLDRWRSGGSCDCGGWDLGCRLSVLSTQHDFSQGSKSFQIFGQGGDDENEAYFRLAPFKEDIYSVEFKTSTISLLQAFFICVAVKSVTHF